MNSRDPLSAIKALADKLAGEGEGIQAEIRSFPSGSAMLDVQRDGRAWVMAYSPTQGFGVDELHADDGITTGFRFRSEEFEPAARRLSELTQSESGQAPTLALLVLRSHDIDQSKEFYSLLGLSLSEEKHGAGPRHYAEVLGDVTFEIYPCRKNGAAGPLHFGVHVPAVDAVVDKLRDHGARIVNEPIDSPWGRRAVVEDPDGNRIELTAPGAESSSK